MFKKNVLHFTLKQYKIKITQTCSTTLGHNPWDKNYWTKWLIEQIMVKKLKLHYHQTIHTTTVYTQRQ